MSHVDKSRLNRFRIRGTKSTLSYLQSIKPHFFLNTIEICEKKLWFHFQWLNVSSWSPMVGLRSYLEFKCFFLINNHHKVKFNRFRPLLFPRVKLQSLYNLFDCLFAIKIKAKHEKHLRNSTYYIYRIYNCWKMIRIIALQLKNG